MKNMLRVLGLTEEQLEGAEKHEPLDALAGKTARHAMQTLGTDWGRRCIDPELWVCNWQRRASGLLEAGKRVVVDDIRFPNEARAVLRLGGLVIRIVRPSQAVPGWPEEHEAESYYPHIPANYAISEDDREGLYRRLETIVA